MAKKVFANGREIACQAAEGKTLNAFPDVCLTPPETPVPYPNTAYAKDTTKGSKTVKISNKEVMLKNKSYFKTSTGDEAGCAPQQGIVTQKIQGKVYFNSWSPNVKIEGKNVVRHLDLTTHNHGSFPGQTPTWPYLDGVNVENNPHNPACCNEQPTPLDAAKLCNKEGSDSSGCDYYQQRHDDYVQRHSCCSPEAPPPPDYYLDYGLKYCQRFALETYSKLSPAGQAWLRQVRCNLQETMERALQKDPRLERDAIKLRKFAFKTHSPIYVKAGLGQLPLTDWCQIATTPNLAEWGHWETWEQALETAWGIINEKLEGSLEPPFQGDMPLLEGT